MASCSGWAWQLIRLMMTFSSCAEGGRPTSRGRLARRRSGWVAVLLTLTLPRGRRFLAANSVQSFVLSPPSASAAAAGILVARKSDHCLLAAASAAASANNGNNDDDDDDDDCGNAIPRIVFSDIDGSLVHYPKNYCDDDTSSHDADADPDNRILALPPSATGMRGIISSKALAACRDLRQRYGVVLVLVSGMRTSTLLNRLPYLPKADAYCAEAGGRIFYPTTVADEDFFGYTPLEYSGARREEPFDDLKPFGLREDMKWRESMERQGAAGTEGYAGNEVNSSRCDESDDVECLIDYESTFGFPEEEVPVSDRQGTLWEYARQLEQEGFVLDTKSYSTCFRVNKKHQAGKAIDKFDALLSGDVVPHPPELDKSTNLGCIDYYPASSGKRNCCQYIADTLGIGMATESACICDDDNDVEMALACSRAYVPASTSASMAETMRNNPQQFTQTFQQGSVTSTAATEAALELIYGRVAAQPLQKVD